MKLVSEDEIEGAININDVEIKDDILYILEK